MKTSFRCRLGVIACFVVASTFCHAAVQDRPGATLRPTELPELSFAKEFFPGATYRTGIPTVESLLGFAVGARAAHSKEILNCLEAWAKAAPERVKMVEYARSHENRPLHYMIVTAPENLSRLDRIQGGLEALGDPRELSEAEARKLVETLPPAAWLAYTIHGDETEGSDAALAVLYHLIAAEDPEVKKLLESLVIIIDPLMNPDGRERFLQMITEHRGAMPNVDDQSLLHTGYLPWGRGNHYSFDLNRDWLYGVHPETRGRMREVARWNPIIFVDAHGMGAQDTHLFSPPRQPINIHLPGSREKWGALFAREQARAFDRHGLVYYTGEWFEEWYPGYSTAWPSYRGAVGILYEQARIAEDGVRRPEGRILTYRESVFHHVIGSMANLDSASTHAKELLENIYQIRKNAAAADGPFARRTFAVLPTPNRARLQRFVELAQLHGFELFETESEFIAPEATDQLGRKLRDKTLPASTILIPNRQPLGHLLAATLDFDPRLPVVALEEERQEILRRGQSRIYDVTAWNLTMMFGLEALTLSMDLPDAAKPYAPAKAQPHTIAGKQDSAVAYVICGADDSSVSAAARLMERGVQVRAAEKPFRFNGHDFARGSIVITALDNRAFAGDLRGEMEKITREPGVTVVGVQSGFGEGDLPDLGGRHFKRLEPPRVAILSRGGTSPLRFGEMWHLLDHRVGIRHSHLNVEASPDLSRYNVILAADRSGPLPAAWLSRLKEWVRAGGTLIAMGSFAAQLTEESADFSRARMLPDVLGRLAEYELAVLREWLARSGDLPSHEAIWSHQPEPAIAYPWQAASASHPEEKELRKRDAWLQLFMPQGAIVSSRVDPNHWLTFGCGEMLPVLAFRSPVLMAAGGVESPVRLGYLAAASGGSSSGRSDTSQTEAKPENAAAEDSSNKTAKQESRRIGWAALPPGAEMHLRMSGLLWPEATHRLANSAFVTREANGRGQIILFASPPNFRGASLGTARLLLNALVYGPGFGSAQTIVP
jgi:hypothetical protein